ncbi:MAG: DUF763 domain-containing protein, partial [Candidatus Bathyarchaeia archaeon]
ICCNKRGETLDLTSSRSGEARRVSLDLVRDNPRHLRAYLSKQATLDFSLPRAHQIPDMDKRNLKTLNQAYEIQPKTYEELISIRGIGPKTLRALALISKLVYGAELSWRDPANYSFAHGGKDGIPYPVDRDLMDETTLILRRAIDEAKLGSREKAQALRRLQYQFEI